MMTQETMNVNPYDGLIASINPPAEVFHIAYAGQSTKAELKRGALLDKIVTGSNAGKYVLHGTTISASTMKANAILAEDIEVAATTDTIVLAYRMGHFSKDKVAQATGKQLTATAKEELREVGILLSDTIEF